MGSTLTHQIPTQNYESITLKRTQRPYHHLYSARDQHKQFVWKTWKYCTQEKAYQQLQKINRKISYPYPFVIAVTDAQFTKTNNNSYKIRAKIEYTQKNLKSCIDKKKLQKKCFTLAQIWQIISKLCLIAQQANNQNIRLPENMSSYFIFDNKIKIQDCQLLPEIRFNKKQSFNFKNILIRIIANLALLIFQIGQVNLLQINRINLKYNVNLATFVFCLKQESITAEDALQLAQRLRQQNNQLIIKNSEKEQINNIQRHVKTVSASTISLNDYLNVRKVQSQRPQQKRYVKSNSEQSLTSANFKRIQQIKPKSLNPKDYKQQISAYICNKEEFVQKQKNDQKLIKLQSQQNKQNYINQANRQQKNIIDIKDHHFPKKLKQFKRTSTTLSEAYSSQNLQYCKNNSDTRNQAFIKMTGGSKCQIFNQSSNQQLLQSIIQSEQSIIIKHGDSPLLQMDHDIDLITQDFFKLQTQFNSAEKQQIRSIMQFANKRNSTIMELTQQNDESANQHIKFNQKQNIASPSQVSPFEANLQIPKMQEEQQQFVIQQYQGGSKYEGYILNGLRNGFGKLYYQDGGFYQGSWKNGEIQGFGKLYYQSGNLAYEGYWMQGEFHGQGKILNEAPEQIKGQFNYHDFSQIQTAWVQYEGHFEHDHKNGQGILMLPNGQKFIGQWINNNVEGEGLFITQTAKEIKGRWENNILVETYRNQIDEFQDCDNY